LTGTIPFSSVTGQFPYSVISNPPSIPAQVTSLPYSSITGTPTSADIFKSTFVRLIYRHSNVFSFGMAGDGWTTTFRVETNPHLQNYQLFGVQYALQISASPYINSNSTDRHIFASVFYSQKNGTFSYTTHKSVGTWVLGTVFNNSGNNLITITVSTPEEIEYLNVNIR